MAETLSASPAAPTPHDLEALVLALGLRPIAGGKTEVEEDTVEVDFKDTDEVAEATDEDALPTTGEEPPEGDEPPTPAAKADAKPEAEATPEPKAEPEKPAEKPAPVEAKASPEPDARPRERLHPAVHEERAKRKEYARLYAEAKEQLDAAEQQIRLLRAAPTAADDPALKKWYEDLAAEADKSANMSDILKLAVREMDRRDRAHVQELNAQLYGLKCDVSEARARARHADWEAVVHKAGLFEAIRTDAQGRFQDPAIAKRVYYTADGGLAPDPAERMYRLAVGKLEYERTQQGDPDDEGTDAPAAAPRVPKAEAKVEAEAERRGAQRVIEQVAKNSTRPRGLRGLPKAEGPTRMTRQQLDRLLEEDPAAYDRLTKKNPGIERFHLGG